MSHNLLSLRPSKDKINKLKNKRSSQSHSISKSSMNSDCQEKQNNIYTTYTSKNIKINEISRFPHTQVRSVQQANNKKIISQQLRKKQIREKIKSKKSSQISTFFQQSRKSQIFQQKQQKIFSLKEYSKQNTKSPSIQQRTIVKLINKVKELQKENKLYKQQLASIKLNQYFDIDRQKVYKILTQLEQYKEKCRYLTQICNKTKNYSDHGSKCSF